MAIFNSFLYVYQRVTTMSVYFAVAQIETSVRPPASSLLSVATQRTSAALGCQLEIGDVPRRSTRGDRSIFWMQLDKLESFTKAMLA